MTDEKEITIYDVINTLKKNRKKVNSKLVLKAYTFAKIKHADQKRLSGESYIIHPLSVANILSEINLDEETICAAILHDVVEDTDVSKEEIANEFGEEIANMVDGVTKLRKTSIYYKRRTTSRKL
jgi:guanosine-3',5'-bis(diphosphate) 3'-pyrophosphohydrolase